MMEDLWMQIIAVLLAYLTGSIPSSVWVGKLFFNKDVRKEGSKNAGATNTFRVLGKKAGIPVLGLDILKGWAAVFLFVQLSAIPEVSEKFIVLQLSLAAAAVLGHIFPVYTNFKGGKGIATLLGSVLAIHFQAALLCIGVFILLFLITKYVSLGTISAAICFPVLLVAVFKTDSPVLVYFSILFAVIILLTHQKNIERLLNNEESKMYLVRNKSNKKE